MNGSWLLGARVVPVASSRAFGSATGLWVPHPRVWCSESPGISWRLRFAACVARRAIDPSSPSGLPGPAAWRLVSRSSFGRLRSFGSWGARAGLRRPFRRVVVGRGGRRCLQRCRGASAFRVISSEERSRVRVARFSAAARVGVADRSDSSVSVLRARPLVAVRRSPGAVVGFVGPGSSSEGSRLANSGRRGVPLVLQRVRFRSPLGGLEPLGVPLAGHCGPLLAGGCPVGHLAASCSARRFLSVRLGASCAGWVGGSSSLFPRDRTVDEWVGNARRAGGTERCTAPREGKAL